MQKSTSPGIKIKWIWKKTFALLFLFAMSIVMFVVLEVLCRKKSLFQIHILSKVTFFLFFKVWMAKNFTVMPTYKWHIRFDPLPFDNSMCDAMIQKSIPFSSPVAFCESMLLIFWNLPHLAKNKYCYMDLWPFAVNLDHLIDCKSYLLSELLSAKTQLPLVAAIAYWINDWANKDAVAL